MMTLEIKAYRLVLYINAQRKTELNIINSKVMKHMHVHSYTYTPCLSVYATWSPLLFDLIH